MSSVSSIGRNATTEPSAVPVSGRLVGAVLEGARRIRPVVLLEDRITQLFSGGRVLSCSPIE